MPSVDDDVDEVGVEETIEADDDEYAVYNTHAEPATQEEDMYVLK